MAMAPNPAVVIGTPHAPSNQLRSTGTAVVRFGLISVAALVSIASVVQLVRLALAMRSR
ncbi:hypothetical protein JCM33774_87340 [Actinophytocola sp. KF-1]